LHEDISSQLNEVQQILAVTLKHNLLSVFKKPRLDRKAKIGIIAVPYNVLDFLTSSGPRHRFFGREVPPCL